MLKSASYFFLIKVAFKFRIGKNLFFQISQKFGSSFTKNGFVYVNLPFLWKFIILGLYKFVTLNFTM